jgi:methylglutaconyl-CoA hydratase
MKKYHTIELQDNQHGLLTVTLNRPEINNALNEQMIDELTVFFKGVNQRENIRLICLKGNGRHFCAGADLNWMKQAAQMSQKEAQQSSVKLYEMYATIDHCKVPLVSITQGAIFGGGLGLLAVSDYVLSDSKSRFCFSELKLGLIPATISPFVIAKIGSSHTKALFLSAREFNAEEALRIGLIHQVSDHLETAVEELYKQFFKTAPEASIICKDMIRQMTLGLDNEKDFTAEIISTARLSKEGQEGMSALLNKRPPSWEK